MDTLYVNLSDVPQMFRGLHGYKGRTYQVSVAEEVQLLDNAWSGGSRSSYIGVNLVTGEVLPPQNDEYSNPFTGQPGREPIVKLSADRAIVKHSYYCGKDAGITIYLHPDNVTKLIPSEEGVGGDEEIVLACSRSYKNSYGGETNLRFKEGNRQHGITQERWDIAKASLIEKKLLSKNGAVTNAGRNVKISTRCY